MSSTQGEEIHQLQNQVKRLTQEVSTLKEKLRGFEEKNPSSLAIPSHNTKYVLHAQLSHLLIEIDPRETLSNHLSPWFGDLCFSLYKNHTLNALLGVFLLGGGVSSLLGVVGLVPHIGFGSFAALPTFLLSLSVYNKAMLRQVFACFDFWILLVCITCFLGAAMDTVQYEASRVCALVMLYMAMFLVITHDARLFTKKRTKHGFWLFGFASVCCWAIVTMYWTGTWKDVHQTVFSVGWLGELEFNVPSVGLSFFTTFCIVVTKYALVLAGTKEINQLVVIRAPISYRYMPLPTTALTSKVEEKD